MNELGRPYKPREQTSSIARLAAGLQVIDELFDGLSKFRIEFIAVSARVPPSLRQMDETLALVK